MYAYLNNKILDNIFGVPEGSILRPLLFTINIIEPFLIEHDRSDFSSCAGKTTLYNFGNTILEAM